MIGRQYAVVLVYSTSYAIRAEKVLHRAGLGSKLAPVPRHLSSNCGVCLYVDHGDKEAAAEALRAAQVDIEGIYDME
jgi:hypothetical protein